MVLKHISVTDIWIIALKLMSQDPVDLSMFK